MTHAGFAKMVTTRTSAPPPNFCAFAEVLGLADRETKRFWAALRQSRWQLATRLRQMFLAYNTLALDPDKFAQEDASPHGLCETLEALRQEKLLTRQEATRIEEVILGWTTKDGVWMSRREHETQHRGATHDHPCRED